MKKLLLVVAAFAVAGMVNVGCIMFNIGCGRSGDMPCDKMKGQRPVAPAPAMIPPAPAAPAAAPAAPTTPAPTPAPAN